MNKNEGTPNTQTLTGGQSEKQIGQWMQIQQNRIDTELQSIRQTQSKLEKATAVIAERTKHTNDRLNEVTLAINNLSTKLESIDTKIVSINTKIAVAIAVIVTSGALLGFFLGSDLAEVAAAVKALSDAKVSK
jgi:chromosome segregation ATPase